MALGLGGSTVAVVTARVQTHREASQASQAFRAVSAQVAASVKLAIQRDQDLVVSTAAFVAGDPTAPNRQFVQWARRVQAIQRYPELLGLGDAVIVTPSRLRAFAAAARHDSAGALGAGGTFTVSPPGHRAWYCFTQNQVSRGGRTPIRLGLTGVTAHCDSRCSRHGIPARAHTYRSDSAR